MIETLAFVFLIYMAVSLVWNILEPSAVKVKFNSPVRAVLAAGVQVYLLYVFLIVVGCSTGGAIAVMLGYMLIDYIVETA